MRNSIVLSAIFFLMFPVLDGTVAQEREKTTLTIINGLDVPICYVYFSLSTDSDWGRDRLSRNEVIEPAAERGWTVEPAMYDLQLKDCATDTLTEVYGVDITQSYRWNVAPDSNSDRREEASQ